VEYPKTRKEARETGGKYYLTGQPCIRGHKALRNLRAACTECLKEEWIKDNAKRSLKPKSEAAKEAGRRYYERNRAMVIARAQARPAEEKKAYKKKYKEENPDLYKTLTSLRRRRFRDATPSWITYKQKTEIMGLYQIAITMTKTTGEQYVVDHIIPLHGVNVCGLHVPWNLRVITQEENLKKSNKV